MSGVRRTSGNLSCGRYEFAEFCPFGIGYRAIDDKNIQTDSKFEMAEWGHCLLTWVLYWDKYATSM